MSRMAIIAPAIIAPTAPALRRPSATMLRLRSSSLAAWTRARSASAMASRRACSSGSRRPPSSVTAPTLRPSHDAGRGVAPVAVAQQALVELAGRQPRELVDEVNGARALEGGQVGAAEREELLLELRSGGDSLHHLDDGLDLFAEVLVGHADDRCVEHLGMGDQQVLGLLGIDVHPARDDHV